jgi:hypothetical protein
MKSLSSRALLAIACAAGLAACGSGSGTLSLSGTITGLTKDGLVLANGNSTVTVAANATGFAFGDMIATDANYNVTVKTQPAAMNCVVTNGSGKASTGNVTTVVVTCTADARELSGNITGLTATGLQLNNGADFKDVPAGATTFTMNKVGDGAGYGITVQLQPTGQNCHVTNGTGTMGATDITSATSPILVACN